MQGDGYYVRPRRWWAEIGARLTVLTTEALPTKIAKALRWTEADRTRQFQVIEFDQVEGFLNERVPLVLDNRAASDQEGKPKLTALYQAIQKWKPNTWVISDGLPKKDYAISHQSARGSNSLKERDLVTVLTFLAPDQYAELCLLGKRFDLDDVVRRHYRDQLRQALGRNRGLRRTEADPSHHVVMSSRLLATLGPDAVMDLGWYQLDLARAPWGHD